MPWFANGAGKGFRHASQIRLRILDGVDTLGNQQGHVVDVPYSEQESPVLALFGSLMDSRYCGRLRAGWRKIHARRLPPSGHCVFAMPWCAGLASGFTPSVMRKINVPWSAMCLGQNEVLVRESGRAFPPAAPDRCRTLYDEVSRG